MADSRNCIVQYFIDPYLYELPEYNKLLTNQQHLADLSAKSFKAYADKHNCDFIRITQPKIKHKHPTFERFDLWLDDSWWDKYDQIMYTDSDVFALPNAPNIFKEYPDLETFKVCNYKTFQDAQLGEQTDVFYKGLLMTCKLAQVIKKGFQPGVFILTKKAVDIMKNHISAYKKLDHHDGEILIWATIQSNVKITRMNEYYNYKNAHMRGHPNVYFYHAAGHKKVEHKEGIITFLASHGIK
jgi:hypothetical protein